MGSIPGIASKDEIVIVDPALGLLITRWLPLSTYPDLMSSRHLLSSLALHEDDPHPSARPARPRLM